MKWAHYVEKLTAIPQKSQGKRKKINNAIKRSSFFKQMRDIIIWITLLSEMSANFWKEIQHFFVPGFDKSSKMKMKS